MKTECFHSKQIIQELQIPGVLISAKNYNSLRIMLEKKNDDAQGEKVLSVLVQRPKEKKDIYKKEKEDTQTHFVSYTL